MDSLEPTLTVIEGLTGSGKTTIADALAARRGAARPQLLPPEFKVVQSLVEDDPSMLEARHALFLAASLRLAKKTVGLLEGGISVVVDSWHFRTTATHRCLGSTLRFKLPAWVPEPTVVVFLEIEESLRQQRIIKRGQASGYWKTECEKHSQRIRDLYGELVPEIRIVDSSASVDAIVRAIEEMYP